MMRESLLVARLMVLFCWLVTPVAFAAPEDAAPTNAAVGMVTGLQGRAVYRAADGNSKPVALMMKIRSRDTLDIEADAALTLVYFASGRQERWQGAAQVLVETGSGASTGVAPQITTLSAGVGQALAQYPAASAAFPEPAGTGGMRVRSSDLLPTSAQTSASGQPARGLSESDKLAIDNARHAYASLRQKTPAEDLAPELYLLSVLNTYAQYEDMITLANKTLQRHPAGPANEELLRLKRWAEARAQAK